MSFQCIAHILLRARLINIATKPYVCCWVLRHSQLFLSFSLWFAQRTATQQPVTFRGVNLSMLTVTQETLRGDYSKIAVTMCRNKEQRQEHVIVRFTCDCSAALMPFWLVANRSFASEGAKRVLPWGEECWQPRRPAKNPDCEVTWLFWTASFGWVLHSLVDWVQKNS